MPTAAKELKVGGALYRGTWSKGRKNDCSTDVYRKMREDELKESLYLKKREWGCLGLTGGLEQGNDKEVFTDKRREGGPQKNLQEKELRTLDTCGELSQLKYRTLKFLCSFFYKHCSQFIDLDHESQYFC